MKVSSIFKPIKRTWSQLTSSSASRSNSLDSTQSVESLRSTVSRTPSLSSLDSFEGLKGHLAAHRDLAAYDALKAARAAGSPSPKKVARKAASVAVAKESARVQQLMLAREQAQLALSKARGTHRIAGIKLSQAQRQHGSHSLIAHQARKDLREATKALGAASADAYMATVLA